MSGTLIVVIACYFIFSFSLFLALWLEDRLCYGFPLPIDELIMYYWKKLTIVGKIFFSILLGPAFFVTFVLGIAGFAFVKLFLFIFVKK